MQLDLNRLNGISSVAERPTTLRFVAAANSFFSVLVFNDQLRGPEPGSIALVPTAAAQRPRLRPPRGVRRVAQAAGNRKTLVGSVFRSCSARRRRTQITFFNVEGHQYDYDATGQLLTITGGNS